MDRDDALKLLRGGEKGVGIWNDTRGADEEIPTLGGLDLRARAEITSHFFTRLHTIFGRSSIAKSSE